MKATILDTQGVNFINIVHEHFSYESKLSSFSLVTFGFVILGAKILFKKNVRKTLMTLTQGVNLINVLLAHFLYESSFKAKT